MKITELKENQVVHCKTHEEAKRVLKLAHEAGMGWSSKDKYTDEDYWDKYRESTCYNLSGGTYCYYEYYLRGGCEIIPSEKITDMENKTEFFEERVMEVSGDGIKWYPRVVFGKKNDKYLAWAYARTVEEAEKIIDTIDWNYAREIDPLLELKKAWARGEDIQYRYKSDDWIDTPNPAWHPFYEYRIKPESESKYVPFTFEDVNLFINKTITSKDGSLVATINYANDNGIVILKTVINYKYLFEKFTFLDGSPCGKEVEE